MCRFTTPHAAAKTREGMTDALANVTPVLTRGLPGRPDEDVVRRALREFSFLPEDRRPEPSPEIVRAVRWLEAASLPLSALEEEAHAGGSGSAGTAPGRQGGGHLGYRRRRAVFHHVLEYAVELEELSANPSYKANPPYKVKLPDYLSAKIRMQPALV
ncbi:hypothetical protein [Streptosporangium minutum]|uniref:hypothetical protein n=1 Tax=Streptosporangium minutum TaxID=569862 RepID=UPI001A985D9F|nr:hypothetical protein [Streptosporangium minutum]